MGDFVLTGSAQFDLIAGITQSLAGRVGRIALLPLTADELAAAGKLPSALEGFRLCGGYPAQYDRELSAGDWFPNYGSTYSASGSSRAPSCIFWMSAGWPGVWAFATLPASRHMPHAVQCSKPGW